MLIRYASGVRVGALTIDPTERVDHVLWTHRPARRPPSGRCIASAELARSWRATLGLPMGAGAVAMGFRIELLPTGYGPGGAAVLLTRSGERVLVVGPTTSRLAPRPAERLVLLAPEPPADAQWAPAVGDSGTLVVPDGGAAAVVSDRLAIAGIAHGRPRWLGRGAGPRCAAVRIATRGPGRFVDARPQTDDPWLVDFARRVGPRTAYVHGPGADRLARRLSDAGLPVRVLHAPRQLSLLADEPEPFVPPPFHGRLETTEGPEGR